MDGREAKSREGLSRRRFLGLAAAGVAVAVLPATAARAQGVEREFSFEGSEINVKPRAGEEPVVEIDGESVEVLDTNGAYRAADFAYSPQPTPDALAKQLVKRRNKVDGG